VLACEDKHEGVPQIGLQALACGIPVVGSDCGGIPEVILDGSTGRIFPTGNAVAMAARIAEAVDEHERTQQMCHAGRALVESQHSMDSMLDRLNAIYERHLTPLAAMQLPSTCMTAVTTLRL